MVAFRFVALGYALLVLLIAPSWLAADEEGTGPAAPVAAVEDSASAVQDAVPEPPGLPAETPATPSDEADEPETAPAKDRKKKADREPEATPAKADEKEQEAKKEPTAKASASASVTISDFKFTPDTVTVNEGDTVTWTNDGPTVHTATAEDGSFDTGTLEKGESGSATFTQAGTINYICTPHPNMKGKVVVQAASAGSPGSGGSGGSTTDDGGSTVAGDDASSGSGTAGLPDTGSEALSIALLGLATLALGLLLRRRREQA